MLLNRELYLCKTCFKEVKESDRVSDEDYKCPNCGTVCPRYELLSSED